MFTKICTCIYLNAYVFTISLKEAGLYVYNNVYLLECICIYNYPFRRLDCMFTIIYIRLNAYVFKMSLKEAGLYVYNNTYLLE